MQLKIITEHHSAYRTACSIISAISNQYCTGTLDWVITWNESAIYWMFLACNTTTAQCLKCSTICKFTLYLLHFVKMMCPICLYMNLSMYPMCTGHWHSYFRWGAVSAEWLRIFFKTCIWNECDQSYGLQPQFIWFSSLPARSIAFLMEASFYLNSKSCSSTVETPHSISFPRGLEYVQ